MTKKSGPKKGVTPEDALTMENIGKIADALATIPDGIFDAADNLENITPQLPQIGVMHRAHIFSFPDKSTTNIFQGIILDAVAVNAWWPESYSTSGGGVVPGCSSLDGIHSDPLSEDRQSELCAVCKQNQFGTGTRDDGSPSRGKACKNMKRVHVMIAGENLPKRLTLAPSSIRSFETYLTILTDQNIPYQLAITEFTIAAQKNRDGVGYSEVMFEKKGIITDRKEALHIKEQKMSFLSAIRGQPVTFEETDNPDVPFAGAEQAKADGHRALGMDPNF